MPGDGVGHSGCQADARRGGRRRAQHDVQVAPDELRVAEPDGLEAKPLGELHLLQQGRGLEVAVQLDAESWCVHVASRPSMLRERDVWGTPPVPRQGRSARYWERCGPCTPGARAPALRLPAVSNEASMRKGNIAFDRAGCPCYRRRGPARAGCGMAWHDFREFLAEIERRDQVRVVEGADCDLEIGTLTELMCERRGPMLLFDHIKGHPPGYRIAGKPYAAPARAAIALGLPDRLPPLALVKVWQERIAGYRPIPPVEVSSGPLLQ